jgi:EmrB/QacA subfamily drug resistance transporter
MASTTPSDVWDDRAGDGGTPMTHRQIMEALSGLLVGMFVAITSSTIISNALPQIVSDLGGGQSAYTWMITAALLAMTATTPLWGKLADLFSKKVLVQTALLIYIAGSVAAGLSQSTEMLIACRVVQGIGVGGLTALAQIILAAMIPPRERGRYSGYLGATFAAATVGGPLLGGIITDTEWLGWRWCFYVGVPFALLAMVVLQKTLRLPVVRRRVKVDWAGATLLTAGVSLLLIWVTFAGSRYSWLSWQTALMLSGSALLGLLFLWAESRAGDPIIPLRLFRNRTITLAAVASLFIGVSMFTGSVFLGQYFQLARGESPTMSGVLTIPTIVGLVFSSTLSGRIITRTGRWKAWLISGGALTAIGLALLGTMRYDTEYWHVAVSMGIVGLGIGLTMQNLVLCAQNQVSADELGAVSSLVTFLRSLGGAIGVAALGAVLGTRVATHTESGLARLGDAAQGQGGTDGGAIPNLDLLPEPVRAVVEAAYGHGVADVYLYSAPLALVAFLLMLFIKEVPLKTRIHSSDYGNPTKPDGTAPEAADLAEVASAPGTTRPSGQGALGQRA